MVAKTNWRTCCLSGRSANLAAAAVQRLRLLTLATLTGAVVNAGFAAMEAVVGHDMWTMALVNLISALAMAAVPLFYRFGELVSSLLFVTITYATLTILCASLGTGTGLQFYFLVAGSAAVMVVGVDRMALAVAVVVVGTTVVITLQLSVPAYTGQSPPWLMTVAFVVNTIAASTVAIGIIWNGLRQRDLAEAALEREYDRSETLLANILPTSVAERLKDPAGSVIADTYDDAAILFADIAGYTERASTTTAVELVAFLNRLYTELDALVARHGLEKVKTSGDSYMVVSGVPAPRPDHLHAVAAFALDMVAVVADLRDPQGRAVPLRIGLADGPVVAGVVGSQRFFYDVWGDAVNVASRMESTGSAGRIQVSPSVHSRLKDDFRFEERGKVHIKGKGEMHTWYLVGLRT